MRLVLDTNVLIAAFVARGVCHDLLEHCQHTHDLITSDFILDEFEGKLLKKFKVPEAEADEARALLTSHMQRVSPEPLSEPVCRDPDDDWILATALTGMCTCIVTGDKDLLVLERFYEIDIVSPSAFWRYETSKL